MLYSSSLFGPSLLPLRRRAACGHQNPFDLRDIMTVNSSGHAIQTSSLVSSSQTKNRPLSSPVGVATNKLIDYYDVGQSKYSHAGITRVIITAVMQSVFLYSVISYYLSGWAFPAVCGAR